MAIAMAAPVDWHMPPDATKPPHPPRRLDALFRIGIIVMDRRSFLHAAIASMASAAMLRQALAADVLSPRLRPSVLAWLHEVSASTQGLRDARLAQPEWQRAMAVLFERVELTDLLDAIDFERLVARIALPHDRAGTGDPRLPDIEGLPRWPHCGLRVFGMARDRAIVPHGHANMVSAHLVVQGQVHVRHYDRVDEDGEVLYLVPTIDRLSTPGDATTVSDDRDNVHWLVARSAAAYTLDFIVVDIRQGRRTRWNDFVDVRAATRLADGRLRAPRIDFDAAIARYGHDVPG
jgi:hypothetical protein